MSNLHLGAAWLVPLPGAEKLTLLAEADHACEFCGLAWPGLALLEQKTGIKRTRLKESLEALLEAGLLEVHAYGRGGRGCSTVYRLLIVECPVAAPCRRCQANLRSPAEGIPRKPRAADKPVGRATGFQGVSKRKPVGIDPKTGRAISDAETAQPEGAQSAAPCARPFGVSTTLSRTITHSAPAPARARARPEDAPAAQPSIPTTPHPGAVSIGEALRNAVPGLRTIAALEQLPMHDTAESADREEAQGGGQQRAP